jgi:hypothetical protein
MIYILITLDVTPVWTKDTVTIKSMLDYRNEWMTEHLRGILPLYHTS